MVLIHQGCFSLINNSYYQDVIYRNLKQSVKDYRVIEEVWKTLAPIQNTFMLVTTICAFSFLLFVLYGVIGNVTPPHKSKVYILLALMIYGLVMFVSVGQQLTDASTEYYEKFCECPWHYWNTRNRKMLLFILTNFKAKSMLNATTASYASPPVSQ
ncbi:unnamed protein product [Acanthoscelides obtectus]|uniref:Uncharacterized protein n=1 Tax=Acanthoscelides obtectus TaxID=200917 RepID=A0A9P0M4Q2_ACAOB|nr:unnamed protein product [Acanthoscelides obtectus]CAK1660276.1 hypothetical protein AOBTE_LOCUS21956 [Acanthoscelides obtectus]